MKFVLSGLSTALFHFAEKDRKIDWSACNGGDLPTAFDYVMKAGGIDLESDYPDKSSKTARTGICKSFQKKVKVTG